MPESHENLKPTLRRVGDLVAESLADEAARMPPSMKERADILRETAKRFREFGSARLVRVWEPADKE